MQSLIVMLLIFDICLHFLVLNFYIWDHKGNFTSCFFEFSQRFQIQSLTHFPCGPFFSLFCHLLPLLTKVIQTYKLYSKMEYKMRKSFLYTCNTPRYSCSSLSPLRKPLTTIWCIFLVSPWFGEKGSCDYLIYLILTYLINMYHIYFSVSMQIYLIFNFFIKVMHAFYVLENAGSIEVYKD